MSDDGHQCPVTSFIKWQELKMWEIQRLGYEIQIGEN